ncbi:MAG: glycoside hydrolase family 3 C-terminal domain-containing protein [Clostridia bacterium]|nr:glycoside hydrolase family 3 C-terminal domain-containing protein [Clostridia bacterium]
MDIKAKAREILANMSLSEKLGQITQVSYTGQPVEEMREVIHKIQPGSLILCGSALGGVDQQNAVSREAINTLQKIALEETGNKIPILFGRDVIHGHRVAFPVPLTMTASWDFDYIEKSYDAIREEAINDGVKWTFTPMLDMYREHRWGRIVEGTGEDPYLGGEMAKAVVKGVQTADPAAPRAMLACAKHFVGYGASEGGRDYNHTEISDYAMQNYYLPAFRAAVDAGCATVMSSFNEINGIPTTGDKRVMTGYLRDQMGFEGFVVSDWEAIAQMHLFSGFAESPAEAARLSLAAGVDMDMMDNYFLDYVGELVTEGKLSVEELDTAVLRILETKLRYGLFANPYIDDQPYDLEKHMDMAQKMAEKSIVLLKNEKKLLPLKKGARIGIAGPMARCGSDLVGTWALDFDPALSRDAADALAEKFDLIPLGEADYRTLYRDNLEACVVMLGETRKVTGEATALVDIGIPADQLAVVERLKKLGKPVIGVFCFARPISFGEYDRLFDAILYAGHGGTRAAEAIAAILAGDAQPEGRLPFTLPYHQGQLPLYYNALPGSRKINGYYGDMVPALSNYCDATGTPNYPFGYGLSYTEFEISEITAETEVSAADLEAGKTFDLAVQVKNVGDGAGVAVPQLYVRDLFGSRIRPLRSLRGHKKLALEAGEEKTVTFTLGKADLGYYLEDGSFILEAGEFDIFIGENCLTENRIRVTVK